MGHRQVIVDIDAPRERVYAIYSDFRGIGRWQSGVRSVDAPEHATMGSSFVVRYGGPFPVRGEVLIAEPPSRHQVLTRELLGAVVCETTATFDDAGGGTRATLDLEYRVRGGPLGGLFDGMVGADIEGRFRKDAAALKRIAEERAS